MNVVATMPKDKKPYQQDNNKDKNTATFGQIRQVS